MKQKMNEESMRYRVPKTANRFWQVHARFILLCLLAAVMAITVALSYFTIRTAQSLSPRAIFLFFCSVEDPAAAERSLRKYDVTFDVFLVRYDERFARAEEDEAYPEKPYDFSSLGSDVENSYLGSFNWDSEKTAVVYINESGTENVITYQTLEEQMTIGKEGEMTLAEIEQTIRLAVEKAV